MRTSLSLLWSQDTRSLEITGGQAFRFGWCREQVCSCQHCTIDWLGQWKCCSSHLWLAIILCCIYKIEGKKQTSPPLQIPLRSAYACYGVQTLCQILKNHHIISYQLDCHHNDRQLYLFNKIREFCPEGLKDTTSPHPLDDEQQSRSPSPIPPKTTRSTSDEPQRKRAWLCGLCQQPGHNSHTCPQNLWTEFFLFCIFNHYTYSNVHV